MRWILQFVRRDEYVIEEVDADEQTSCVARLHFCDDDLAGEGSEDDQTELHADVRRAVAAVDDRRTHAVHAVQSDAQTLIGKNLDEDDDNDDSNVRRCGSSGDWA
jgi:hypothetical protein